VALPTWKKFCLLPLLFVLKIADRMEKHAVEERKDAILHPVDEEVDAEEKINI